jgi:hypothetical protein
LGLLILIFRIFFVSSFVGAFSIVSININIQQQQQQPTAIARSPTQHSSFDLFLELAWFVAVLRSSTHLAPFLALSESGTNSLSPRCTSGRRVSNALFAAVGTHARAFCSDRQSY